MIIHLDSNYRNRALYPNPASYVIEINGTPPANQQISDSRGFFLTQNNISFSFYFSKISDPVNYNSYKNNTVSLDVNNIPYFNYFLQLSGSITQNFLVGFIARDDFSQNSAIITGSYKENNLLVLTLENNITQEYQSTLHIINPSLVYGNNLLINGYSVYNFTPNLGYFQNDGINNSSVIFNLTKGLQTSVLSLTSPYRNITFAPLSLDNKTPFTIDEGDYIVVINGKAQNQQKTNYSYVFTDIFPNALLSFDVLVKPDDLEVGDIFVSTYGEEVATTFPIFTNTPTGKTIPQIYFKIPQNYNQFSTPRKIILQVEKIEKHVISFKILLPGNGIEIGQSYTLFSMTDPNKTIQIRSKSVYFCIQLREPIHVVMDRFMAYFLNLFIAVPFYAAVVGSQNNFLYMENPYFFIQDATTTQPPFQYIYTTIGLTPFYSYYPNLSLPVSNLPLSCYKVRISSISLPNLPICGTNFLLADFPYVFVTFGTATDMNIEERGGTNNLGTIWSNNPNALNATFVCAIANIKTPDIVKFVVVRSGQVVNIKLNLAQNLRFSVYLPDGTLVNFTKSYELNAKLNKFVSGSTDCADSGSLTKGVGTTAVFSFEEELNISATFFLSLAE